MTLQSFPAGSVMYLGGPEDKGFTMLTSSCSSWISTDSGSTIAALGEFLREFILEEYCGVAAASIAPDSRCCKARFCLSSSRFL